MSCAHRTPNCTLRTPLRFWRMTSSISRACCFETAFALGWPMATAFCSHVRGQAYTDEQVDAIGRVGAGATTDGPVVIGVGDEEHRREGDVDVGGAAEREEEDEEPGVEVGDGEEDLEGDVGVELHLHLAVDGPPLAALGLEVGGVVPARDDEDGGGEEEEVQEVGPGEEAAEEAGHRGGGGGGGGGGGRKEEDQQEREAEGESFRLPQIK